MEEMRQAALAYYSNLTQDEKNTVAGIFHKMDTDGNGSISLSEYVQYLKSEGYGKMVVDNRVFKEFDKDGNGVLDYDEFITFSYLLFTRRFVFCDGCDEFLKGIYFTCSQCFDKRPGTYDLCCKCFRGKNFSHHSDAIFYDNYALLRSDKLVTLTPETTSSKNQLYSTVNQTDTTMDKPKERETFESFLEVAETLNTGVGIVNILAIAGCRIM